ncbi:MAG: phage terminase large subunit [Burkholderiaceae bacterium]|nr:phage terminase large subunit [Burkholderiaceae bacterium]
MPVRVIKPQAGPQEQFLASPADIAIYGGAAGSGKTWGVLMEPLRYVTNTPDFYAVFFRRNTTHIRNPGGLWDASMKLYPLTGGEPNQSILEWRWKVGGGKIKMGHLDQESTVLDWQGSEIPLIIFDELTHFSETQFFYMMSRNRSMSGVRPYIRATCNPDADSWVAKFIEWWIDQETGYPIKERSGVIRWFLRLGDSIVWADSRAELIQKYGQPELPGDHPDQVKPKSVTFIPAKLSDNKLLMQTDPDYKANLMALSRVERERLLMGNWKIRPAAGLYFKPSDASPVSARPNNIVSIVRKWDLAATEPSESNADPDWTVGALMAKLADGRYIILDIVRERLRAHRVRELVAKVAKMDGHNVRIGLSQDPGQAGKEQAASYVAMLAGYSVSVTKESGDKITRAEPFAAQWQAGNVDYYTAPWNKTMLDELEAFPTSGVHDDQVDALSGAFSLLNTRVAAKPSTGGQRVYADTFAE